MPLEKARTTTKKFAQPPDEGIAAVQAGHDPLHEMEPIAETHAHEDSSNGPDDALGLYLKQMGAIPLLNRSQELVLAEKLERARDRFRRAVFCSWTNLEAIYNVFRRVQTGDIPVDPVIDVVTSLHRSKDEIVQRMPTHMRALKKLLDSSTTTFRNLLRRPQRPANCGLAAIFPATAQSDGSYRVVVAADRVP